MNIYVLLLCFSHDICAFQQTCLTYLIDKGMTFNVKHSLKNLVVFEKFFGLLFNITTMNQQPIGGKVTWCQFSSGCHFKGIYLKEMQFVGSTRNAITTCHIKVQDYRGGKLRFRKVHQRRGKVQELCYYYFCMGRQRIRSTLARTCKKLELSKIRAPRTLIF